jgi:hypothetical protein
MDGTLNPQIAAALRRLAAKSFDREFLLIAAKQIEEDGEAIRRLREEVYRLRAAQVGRDNY